MALALIRRALAAVLLAAAAGAGLAATAWAQGLLPVPTLTARVIDQTQTLGESERADLEAKLAAFEQRKGSQIVVLMVATTQPEDIASYANRVGNAWKIGRKEERTARGAATHQHTGNPPRHRLLRLAGRIAGVWRLSRSSINMRIAMLRWIDAEFR